MKPDFSFLNDDFTGLNIHEARILMRHNWRFGDVKWFCTYHVLGIASEMWGRGIMPGDDAKEVARLLQHYVTSALSGEITDEELVQMIDTASRMSLQGLASQNGE